MINTIVLMIKTIVLMINTIVLMIKTIVLMIKTIVLMLREVVLMIKAIILNLKTTTYYLYFITFALNNHSMRYLYITLISCFLALNLPLANAQIITTVAGTGWGGVPYSGDGGQATAAKLDYPEGIAFDAIGNMYIADAFNSRIRMVNTLGVITTIAGNGTAGYSGDGGVATAAELRYPSGVAVSPTGNLYIADQSNARVRMVNTSGIITTVVGNGTGGNSGDGGQATAAEIYASAIAFDMLGNLYVFSGPSIRKVNTLGIITTVAGNGTSGYSGDGGQATAAELGGFGGLALNATGNLYIADYYNYRIRMINTSGIITTVAGNGISGYSGDGGQATSAEFNSVYGVAVDGTGNFYFSDYDNFVVRKVNTTGIITTIAGNGIRGYSGNGGQATAAELGFVYGLAFDAADNLYISDDSNNVVHKVTNVAAAGIEQFANSNEQVTIYPNPATNSFQVSLAGNSEETSLSVYNMLGNTVKQATVYNSQSLIDISELNSGIYVLELSNSTGRVVKRLIKE